MKIPKAKCEKCEHCKRIEQFDYVLCEILNKNTFRKPKRCSDFKKKRTSPVEKYGCRDCENKVKYLRECGLNDKQIEKVIKGGA